MLRKFLVILIVGILIVLLVLGPQTLTSFLLNLGVIDGVEGYVIAAGIALVTNAFIFLPVYNVTPIIVEIADHNTLWLVAGVYALASAVGESTAYFVGQATNKIPGFQQSGIHERLVRWMRGWHTGPVIFGLAISPLPFDVAGMVAGGIRFPLRWFIALTFAGRWIKYLVFLPSWEFFEKLISQIPLVGNNAETVMFATSLLLVVILMWVVLIANLKKHWNGTSDNKTEE